LALRGVWNLAFGGALGALSFVILRRQGERLIYMIRWGHQPHEPVHINDHHSNIGA
jgi:hypothetical protein